MMLNITHASKDITKTQLEYCFTEETNELCSYFLKAVKIEVIAKNLEFYVSQLSNRENELFSSYRNQKRKMEWLAGRIALKALLKEKFSTNNEAVEILKNPLGAPYINNNDKIWISISHSHNMAIVAAALYPIGIDVEYLESQPRLSHQLFFNSEETAFFDTLKDDQKKFSIIKSWTFKEAVSKVLGLGGKMNFKHIFSLKGQYTDPVSHLHISSKTIIKYGYLITIAFAFETSGQIGV
ncbi:MAG: 4'-phosphopantetheinyl transferase superfamily protein [Spirochaetales bacterium]|nr:4'-phosphopantetheinyl transferase superfamily protein [Spirochaetales bacterium]